MRRIDLYSRMLASLDEDLRGYDLFERDPELRFLAKNARDWEMDQESIREWLESPIARERRQSALEFLAAASGIVSRVEHAFGRELPGTLLLLPSFGEFDGFARYELGEHRVLLGIDYPDSDPEYLRALCAHELSHVHRDHSPRVWAHLGKPLEKVSRREYLNASTAQEHLVSEGLATLFSQALFPEVPERVHHYYEEPEWQWCRENDLRIDKAFVECLAGDADVWSFYSPSRVAPGSPSRTQYYWAARKIAERLGVPADRSAPEALADIVALHGIPSAEFPEFSGPS
jgi:hypothetical protein